MSTIDKLKNTIQFQEDELRKIALNSNIEFTTMLGTATNLLHTSRRGKLIINHILKILTDYVNCDTMIRMYEKFNY